MKKDAEKLSGKSVKKDEMTRAVEDPIEKGTVIYTDGSNSYLVSCQ